MYSNLIASLAIGCWFELYMFNVGQAVKSSWSCNFKSEFVHHSTGSIDFNTGVAKGEGHKEAPPPPPAD